MAASPAKAGKLGPLCSMSGYNGQLSKTDVLLQGLLARSTGTADTWWLWKCNSTGFLVWYFNTGGVYFQHDH